MPPKLGEVAIRPYKYEFTVNDTESGPRYVTLVFDENTLAVESDDGKEKATLDQESLKLLWFLAEHTNEPFLVSDLQAEGAISEHTNLSTVYASIADSLAEHGIENILWKIDSGRSSRYGVVDDISKFTGNLESVIGRDPKRSKRLAVIDSVRSHFHDGVEVLSEHRGPASVLVLTIGGVALYALRSNLKKKPQQ